MTRGRDLVDQILGLDPGRRDIAAFSSPGAATKAARALRGARRVLIITGFAVEPDMPETDGPPGATVLGRALRRLGARVTYVTDTINVPLVEGALKVLDEPLDVVVYPGGADGARRLLDAEKPTHLVAIERPGRNRVGDYLNMRGHSVAGWNAPIDELFVDGQRRARRPVTIGIGDGGNEIGMGVVRAKIARLDPLRARIATVVPVDHLVVAGVSNWGSYGIVAALGRLVGSDLLHTPELERRLIAACVAVGACDGVTRRREHTVDGLAADTHAAIVDLFRLAAIGVPGFAARSGMIGAGQPRRRS
ncbi:MAG TPA: DUF4392 domain-containing protein [Methylomirabilota bacterium]|nr:DUF4392 domain-containing protein [Methylomirabilota bacterium]